MNFFTLTLAAVATLTATSCGPVQTSGGAPVQAPDMMFIPALSVDYAEEPEKLTVEIGSDGPLGNTCWTHSTGELALSGITKADGSVVYDPAPDYSRCASMDAIPADT